MEEKDFEKKGSKKAWIISGIVLVVILIAIAAGLFAYSKINQKPNKVFAKLIEDTFETLEEDSKKRTGKVNLGVTASLSGTSSEIDAINAYLGVMKLNLTTEVDLDKKIIIETASANILGEPVINLQVLMQNNKVYGYLKDIYSKYIELPEDALEGENLSETFEVNEQNIAKNAKEVLNNVINSKEIVQEKAKVDGKNALKTTIRLTPKELLEITDDILKKEYENNQTDKLKTSIENLEMMIEDLEEGENYVDVSVYTNALTSQIIKTEFKFVSYADNIAFTIEIEKVSGKESEIRVLLNDEIDNAASSAKEVLTIKVNKENDKEGTVKIKTTIEEGYNVILKIDYSVEHNINIESRDVSNSIKADELTEEDYEEIRKNIQENPMLSAIMQQISGDIEEEI